VELDDKMASTLVDPADNPETALQKKNTGEVLRRCVTGLSPAHGQIIDLVYHEKSVSEVAEILATRMFYARKRLGDLVMAA
jgi:RNA polymerase sigma-70 factor, ECF subfamily